MPRCRRDNLWCPVTRVTGTNANGVPRNKVGHCGRIPAAFARQGPRNSARNFGYGALVAGVWSGAVHAAVERLPLGQTARGLLVTLRIASEVGRGVCRAIHESVELRLAAPDQARLA